MFVKLPLLFVFQMPKRPKTPKYNEEHLLAAIADAKNGMMNCYIYFFTSSKKIEKS